MSDFTGGGVDITGEETGLVSMGVPFKRLSLTSANLHRLHREFSCVSSSDWAADEMDGTL